VTCAACPVVVARMVATRGLRESADRRVGT
jgi:hypothetical protein